MDHSQHHSQNASDDQKDHTVSRILTGLAIGAGVIGVGVMLAPHILPALGVTSADLAEEASLMIHTGPVGMAGAINTVLGKVPLIGAQLAGGGFFTAGASALVGIGGVLLGQFIESKEDGTKSIKWGNVIKYGALITSALIAMPAILSSLSTGIIYAGIALNNSGIITTAACNSLIAGVSSTLGGIGGAYAHNWFGLSGLSAVIPHLLCCGAPFAPALLSFFSKGKKEESFTDRLRDSSAVSEQKYSDGSIIAEMKADKPLAAGVPCVAKLTLKNAHTGQPITPEELAVVHTEKLHLFVADSSLKDYHHIHPKPTSEAGVFACSFTPATSNNYSAWADFTLLKDGKNHKLKTEIPSASGRSITPTVRANTHAESSGLSFDWKSSEPLRKDAASIVEVNVTDASGKPVNDLEPVMGAFAHLVGFSADGKSIIHTHPMGAEPINANERGGSKLRFHVEPDCAGATQFYLQVRRNGDDIYVPFGQQIQPPIHAMKHSLTAHQHASYGYQL